MCIICRRECKEYKDRVELDCSFCPNLTKIPYIEGLQILYCWCCPNLTEIPNIDNMAMLCCNHCYSLTDTGVVSMRLFRGLEYLECCHCTWLPFKSLTKENLEYKENIQKLQYLQRIFKKWLPFKRLERFVSSDSFNEWFYSPEGPGGKNAIRRLECNGLAS